MKAFILHDPGWRQANAFVAQVVVHVPLLEFFGCALGGIPARLLLQLEPEADVLRQEASNSVLVPSRFLEVSHRIFGDHPVPQGQ